MSTPLDVPCPSEVCKGNYMKTLILFSVLSASALGQSNQNCLAIGGPCDLDKLPGFDSHITLPESDPIFRENTAWLKGYDAGLKAQKCLERQPNLIIVCLADPSVESRPLIGHPQIWHHARKRKGKR